MSTEHPLSQSRATLADVAAAAGVSKMTASRALRGAADVSRASAEKVAQAARQLGYVGNPLAASFSSQHSNLIGVVVPSLSNIVFAEVLSGIAEGIGDSGMQPVFGVSDYDAEKEHSAIRAMLSWKPAGLIVTGLDQPPDTRALLQSAGVPVVQIMDLDGDPVDACAGVSQRGAGQAMAGALVDAGCRRFGYVGAGLARDTRAQKRLDGFRAGLKARGLRLMAHETAPDPSTATGRQLTAKILRRTPDLDCLYFSNDDLAAGGAYHCIAAGIAVPGDLRLAGFNGLEFLDSLPVRIATSRTPRRAIGAAAARAILSAPRTPSGAPPVRVEFHPEIRLET